MVFNRKYAQNRELRALLDNTIPLARSGNKELAIQRLSAFCERQPNNADIRREIGIFLQQSRMPYKAELFYHDALRIDNNQPLIYFNLGVMYQNLNRIDDAMHHYIQAIRIAPDYVEALANLAYIYKQKGHNDKCLQTGIKAKQLAPDDPQVTHMVAALGIEETPDKANPEYVENLFDEYAEYYEQHLSITLDSQVPSLIYQAAVATFEKHESKSNIQNISVLDLGCGTGLCGELFSKHTQRLVGVDLSENMLAKAKDKNVYTALDHSDINAYLRSNTDKYDIIISSDVLIYIGNLNNVFNGVSKALFNSGIFAFSIESSADTSDGYLLSNNGRYKHSHNYIAQLSEQYGFSMISHNTKPLRKQNDKDVDGTIYVLKNSSKNDGK